MLAVVVFSPVAQVVDPGDADDRRDVVHAKAIAQPIRGRVVTPFDPDELLILQGVKRVRVERDRVELVDTVNDRLTEFFARRDRLAQTTSATSGWRSGP